MMTPVTLHHCHGGSMKDAGWHVGVAQKQNPFLQIPLHARFHVGDRGVDYGVGVLTWEARYGTQIELLHWVDEQLGYPLSVFELAKEWSREHSKCASVETTSQETRSPEERLGKT